MSSTGIKGSNSSDPPNHILNSHLLSSELPESRISLQVLSPPKGAMGQFYLHRLQLSRAKLKASSRTSALLSGFAMVAMVEIDLNPNSSKPVSDVVITLFGVCTVLLIAVHLLALMISTCILPHMGSSMHFDGGNGQITSQVMKSPHDTMHRYIEIAWIFSTVLGIILFLVEIGLLCWIQFHDRLVTQLLSTLLLVLIVFVFLFFAFQFYIKLVKHTYKNLKQDLDELEEQLEMFQEQQSCVQTV